MFAALHAGAPFGYLDWVRVVLWATLGNMIGGIGLVTVLRLVQVGRGKMKEEEVKAGGPHQHGQAAPARAPPSAAAGDRPESRRVPRFAPTVPPPPGRPPGRRSPPPTRFPR